MISIHISNLVEICQAVINRDIGKTRFFLKTVSFLGQDEKVHLHHIKYLHIKSGCNLGFQDIKHTQIFMKAASFWNKYISQDGRFMKKPIIFLIKYLHSKMLQASIQLSEYRAHKNFPEISFIL